MALPDYSEKSLGTPITWRDSGGTAAITLASLADGAARKGARVDLGANFSASYALYLTVVTGTTPLEGSVVEVYFGESPDNTLFPGGLASGDGAFTLGTNELNLRQIPGPSAFVLQPASAGTTCTQGPFLYRPTGRYVQPVVVNRSGGSTALSATAGHIITLVPIRDPLND